MHNHFCSGMAGGNNKCGVGTALNKRYRRQLARLSVDDCFEGYVWKAWGRGVVERGEVIFVSE